MTQLNWCGVRESEVAYDRRYFDKVFAIHGSGKDCLQEKLKRRIDHNDLSYIDLINDYYIDSIKATVEAQPAALFMFYNQQYLYDALVKNNLLKHTVGLNDPAVVKLMSDKFTFREQIADAANVIGYTVLRGAELTPQALRRYSSQTGCVLQQRFGSGGSGTIIVTQDQFEHIATTVDQEDIYMITPYYAQNVPVNIHCIISDSQVILAPPSIQIIEEESAHLAYRGCDYSSYHDHVTASQHEQHVTQSLRIATLLQDLGYRGVCGIDSIVADNKVYFMEINARFQNSSTALNKALHEHKLPSLQALHFMCHHAGDALPQIGSIHVPYSTYMVDFGQAHTPFNDAYLVEKLDMIDSDSKVASTSGYSHTELYASPIAHHFVAP